MSNQKISQLPAGTPAQALDEFRIARPDGLGGYDDFELKIQDVSAYVDTDLSPLKTSQLGAASGVAPLNGASQVPVANLPYSAIAYQGTWNAATNTPSIADGVGINGEFYWVSVAGATVIDGNGPWSVGDVIVFNGTTVAWEQATMGTSSPGPIGPPGADGKTILSGAVNPTGGTGVNGDFYINTVTNFIFGPKTGGVWPAGVSLVGPAGANGTNGTNGTNGAPGVDGKTVLNGAGAPGVGVGIVGDFYIDTSTNRIYGPKLVGGWPVTSTSLVGPQGPAGSSAGAINNVSTYGAIGNGANNFIGSTINPATGTNYTLAAANAKWNLVRERWSIDVFNFASLTAYPVGGTVTFSTGIATITATLSSPSAWNPAATYSGNSNVTYLGIRYRCIQSVTTAGTPPPSDPTHWAAWTTTNAAKDIASEFNDGIPSGQYLDLAAEWVGGSQLWIYSKSTATVNCTLGNGVTGTFTKTRTKTYNDSIINIATDTMDWVAIQQALYEVETTNGQGKKVLDFGYGANYVLSRGLILPSETGTGNSSAKMFTINGNNSTLRGSTNNRMKLMSRDIPCQRVAENGVNSSLPKIDINSIEFKLPFFSTRDTNPKTQAAGLVLGGYQCSIKDCVFQGGDIGLDIQFGLQTFVNRCNFVYQNVFGIAIRNGQWFEGALSNAQSNGTIVDGCKFRLADQTTPSDPAPQVAGIYVSTSSDCSIRNIIFEGGDEGTYAASNERCLYGLFFDTQGATVVKDFEIYNVHLEKSFKYAAFFGRALSDTIMYIGKVTLIATNSGAPNRLVDFGAGPVPDTQLGTFDSYSGYPRVTVENFPYKPPTGAKIFHSAGSGTCWRITDVTTGTSGYPNTATQFITAPYAADIWNTSAITYQYYDGNPNNDTYNTIVPITGSGVIPSSNRIRVVADNYFQ